MKKYLILGSGTMGQQIAEAILISVKECEIFIFSATGANLKEKNILIRERIEKLAKIGRFKYPFSTEEINRLEIVADLKSDFEPDFIFECLEEDFEKKSNALNKYSNLFDKSIISTNTSSLSVNELSKFVKFPERFFGCHFFNPVLKTRFAEIIYCNESSEIHLKSLIEETKLSLKDLVCIKDNPGFIVNNLIISMIEVAIEIHINQEIGFEEIDKSAKMGGNFIAGPFEIADMIGLDITYKILENLDKKKYLSFLKQKLEKNEHGRKTGIGFYKY